MMQKKPSLTAMLKFPFEKLQHLQAIYVRNYHDQESINIIKKLMSLNIKEVHMDNPWKSTLNPGDKLTILTDGYLEDDDEDLPKDLPQKHPNLREFQFEMDGTVDNFRILNGLRLLTRVELSLDFPPAELKTIRPLFQSLLSMHIQLVDMEVELPYEHLNDFIQDITTRRRELRSLVILSGRSIFQRTQTIDWNLFMNMSKLRKLDLQFPVENQIPDLEMFYDSLPKLTNFTNSFSCVDSSEEMTEKYLKKHPERSILFSSF